MHTLPSHAACGYGTRCNDYGTLFRYVLPNPAQIGSALSDLIGGGGRRRQQPDFRQAFYLALARVLGAAAWIDEPINQQEVNVIKSLLNELSPRLTSREVQSVQRYLTEPVPGGHWDELLLALSEFTRRRGRLQFALQRLQSLLAADGEFTDAEQRLFAHARAALDWRGSQPAAAEPARNAEARAQVLDRPHADPAAPEPHDSGADIADGSTGDGIRLGDLAGGVACDTPPSMVDRVCAAAADTLGAVAEDRVRRLAVWCVAVVYVTVRRARTDGEDAELVGFLAAVTGVDEATAEAVLEQTRALEAAGMEVPVLAAELHGAATAIEVASLAQLLNAMAGGDAALRRLKNLSRGMPGLAW